MVGTYLRLVQRVFYTCCSVAPKRKGIGNLLIILDHSIITVKREQQF